MMLINLLQVLCFVMHVFITVETKDNYGAKGSNVTLVCPFKKGSTGSLYWSYSYANFSTTAIYTMNSFVNDQLPTELYSRLSITGNNTVGEYNLQIRYIQESDEGIYSCYISGSLLQDIQTLNLIWPPSSVSIANVTSTDRVLGTEGEDLTLSCVAVGGKPPPNVTLNIDGISVASGNLAVKFTLKSLSRSYDRKTVMCQAHNEANVNNPNINTALLYLHLKPRQPIFSSDPVSTEETKPLVVSCTSYGSRPQATFQWMIGQATIPSGITTTPFHNTADDTYTVISTLTFTVDRTYNGQTLTCGAFNNVSTSGALTSTTLDVKFAPGITVNNLTSDQNTAVITLNCIPVGNPTTYTYYRWHHKSTYGVLIRELDGGQNGVLTLPSVPVVERYQESGEYVCTANNGITDRNGKINQTGFGYVIVSAPPTFTNENTNTQYGEFRKDVDIHVYVYSVPKYTSLKWYKSYTEVVKTNRSELEALVYDTFHGTTVQLNGYRVTLTIKNLVELDFNVSYRVELSNVVGQSVLYSTLLVSASAPETPANFTAVNPSESSIVVQWEAGYNGGHDQTFYVEYRGFGSNIWMRVKVQDTKQTGRQTYTLTGLQEGTLYELRMYAENRFNKSSTTQIKAIKTIKDISSLSKGAVVGGVAGGLIGGVVILAILLFSIHYKRKQGLINKNQKAKSERPKVDKAYENISGRNFNDTINELMTKERVEDTKQEKCSNLPYESLGMKDIANVYDKLTDNQNFSPKTYEELGIMDSPNTYEELVGQTIENTTDGKIKDGPHLYIEVIDPKVNTQFTSSVRHYKNTEDDQDKVRDYENLKTTVYS